MADNTLKVIKEDVLIMALELALDDSDFFPYEDSKQCEEAYAIIEAEMARLRKRLIHYK